MFSHQEGALESRFDVDRVTLDVQRYLVGIQEEHIYGRTRFIGVALIGATRDICAGGCLFVFNGNGLWQGDVSAGVSLAF
jgi:hypothetical protein